MSEHHHHHHHRKDSATRFKERSLQQIVIRKKLEKGLKIALVVIAAIMAVLLVLSYLIGN